MTARVFITDSDGGRFVECPDALSDHLTHLEHRTNAAELALLKCQRELKDARTARQEPTMSNDPDYEATQKERRAHLRATQRAAPSAAASTQAPTENLDENGLPYRVVAEAQRVRAETAEQEVAAAAQVRAAILRDHTRMEQALAAEKAEVARMRSINEQAIQGAMMVAHGAELLKSEAERLRKVLHVIANVDGVKHRDAQRIARAALASVDVVPPSAAAAPSSPEGIGSPCHACGGRGCFYVADEADGSGGHEQEPCGYCEGTGRQGTQPALPDEGAKLRCEVRLPPGTTFGPGVSIATLLLAINDPKRPTHFAPDGNDADVVEIHAETLLELADYAIGIHPISGKDLEEHHAAVVAFVAKATA